MAVAEQHSGSKTWNDMLLDHTSVTDGVEHHRSCYREEVERALTLYNNATAGRSRANEHAYVMRCCDNLAEVRRRTMSVRRCARSRASHVRRYGREGVTLNREAEKVCRAP